MSTPPPQEIAVGDTWELSTDLGVGLGALPAGSEVVIFLYLSPDDYYSPSNEYTVVSRYVYTDWGYDDTGNWALIGQQRLLAYPETDFRLMFVPGGGAE